MDSAQNTPNQPTINIPSLPPLMTNSNESGTVSLPKATDNTGVSPGPPQCEDASSAMLMDRRGDDGVEILEETGTAYINNSTVFLIHP